MTRGKVPKAWDIGMTLIDPELEWEVNDDGDMVETTSIYFDYVIDLDDVLFVYDYNSNHVFAKRQCANSDHAEHVAKAFEIGEIRKGVVKRAADKAASQDNHISG